MVTAYLVLLAMVAGERLLELRISRRNQRWSLDHGGIELGREHFGYMKALHSGFFISCALEVVVLDRPFIASLGAPMLVLVVAAQALRYWAVSTLGKRWNVRVIVLPGVPVVTTGPYRYFRHPNYLAVVVEGIALPLVHTAWMTAIGFTLLNAWMLSVRIRCEDEALASHCR